MSAATDRFQFLIQQVAPLDREAAVMKLEMVQLAGEIGVEILTEAFPEAKVLDVRCVSEIRPSDNGKSARDAVVMIKQNTIEPKFIIRDTARHVIWVAIDPLPRAANPKPTKKKGKK